MRNVKISRAAIKRLVSVCKTKSEFRTKHGAAYRAAQKMGILIDIWRELDGGKEKAVRGSKFSRKETRTALRLYLKGAPRKEVEKAAMKMERPTSSLLCKISNFAYLDTGRGFEKGGALTQSIWEEHLSKI